MTNPENLMRAVVLSLLALVGTLAQAQQPVKLISLPTLDSTYLLNFLERTGGGYVMSTVQPDQGVTGTTIISTDDMGTPLGALRLEDRIWRMIRCSDGGYLIMGSALIKTDAAFNVLWSKKLAAPLPTQYFVDITERDGNAFAVYNVKVTDVDPALSFYPTYGAVIFKFNSGGDLVGQRILVDTVFAIDRMNLYLSRPVAGDNGSLYLSLKMLPYSGAGTCGYLPTVIKLDSTLNVAWAYRYPLSAHNGVAGLMQLANGDLALHGVYGTTFPYCTKFKPFLQRIDAGTGNLIFCKGYPHVFQAEHSTGEPLQRANGTFIVPRTFMDTVAGHHVSYFERLSTSGDVVASSGFDMPWANTLDGLLQVADNGGSEIAACRLNKRDSILFTRIDTTLITTCHSVPNLTASISVAVNRTAFVPAYRSHPFVFVDTTYAPLQPVPVSTVDPCDLTTNVAATGTHEWTLFPNPSRGEVRINGPRPINELVVYDVLGQVVHRSRPNSASAALDLSGPGIYFLRITDASGEQVKKVVVEGR